MNAAIPNTLPAASAVRPADRLGFTLFIAALVHVVLILGLGFSMPEPSEVSKSLEITLASFKSDKAPEKADFLAQENQQGSGTLDKALAPSTTEEVPFKDSEIKPAVKPTSPRQTTESKTPKAAVTTKSARQDKAPTRKEKPEPEAVARETPHFDNSQISSEIASLEAQLSQERQQYAKRPKIYRINAASTMKDKGAWYKEDWRKKIERVGNLNYPEQARRERLYGSLRLLVSINRDGSLYEVQILESSGQTVLDQAALRIVRLAAPFAPFSGDLSDIDRLEIIRTWRFERGDRLASQ
ncbi:MULTISPECIES: energy transducer TonB [Pseudomonas]|uniref:energy transducer TonB n=1 Tax=Pseudomonas TaxID=286 RepID=UPI001C6082A5|nr:MULTISPECIES: energy transducer TonB [Pseudomonas]MBW5415608.1 TonB family protein [Pseudomonas sp. MAG002Y]MCG7372266.1 energy transducer TonB [Pseudomonas luteola]